jgi:hypothetical protein
MYEPIPFKRLYLDSPYDLSEPDNEREVIKGLIRLTQNALSKYIEEEPNIY